MKTLQLLLLTMLCFPALAQNAWELVKSDSNVTVFTKQLPGKPYKSFKAVGVVQATPEELLEILDDVARYKQWFAYSSSVRLLQSTENEKYVYMETNFPWPFSNEDMIYRLSVSENENEDLIFSLNGTPSFIPTVNGIKRMRAANGYILFEPDKVYTKVTYVMHAELSGDIPPWLANANIHLLPFKTLKNFIRIAEEGQVRADLSTKSQRFP